MSANRFHTAEPWAAPQLPRAGRDDLAPLWAIVYGALAIGMRPDGSIVLVTLRDGRGDPRTPTRRYRQHVDLGFSARHAGARLHGLFGRRRGER